MDKSFLEDRIKVRAISKYYKLLREAGSIIDNNEILRRLKIKDDEGKYKNILYEQQNWSNIIMREENNLSNITDIKKDLIAEFEKEETDIILNRLKDISYLYNNI